MQCRARLLAVAAALTLACCFARGAASAHAVSRHRQGGHLATPRARSNREDQTHVGEAGTPQSPPSVLPSNTDLEDLLRVLAQRKHLTPRPRLLPFIVNPFSPLLFCDHHYGTEYRLDPDIAINPLDTNGTATIKPCATVCVNAEAFEAFARDVLPRIQTRIVLFTSRYYRPQVERSPATDAVKAHPAIAHWFAQNPVYPGDARYTAFPYGIRPSLMEHYAAAFLAHHTAPLAERNKTKTIEHLPVRMTHPSRKPFLTAHARRVPDLSPPEFYRRIARARFLISPRGDRPDTYRHWEAIGLGAVPIANINRTLYGSLFGDDMVYMEDAARIVGLLDEREHDALDRQYHVPAAHRLSSLFWARRVGAARDACLSAA